jgi:uncharacterized protein (DUF983 family)
MTDSGASAPVKRQPGLVRAAFFALCPQCGASGVFAAPARFAARCRGCGLDLAAHELSPRSLYPVIAPLVVILVLAALKLDDTLHPPLWVHALVWPPVVVVTVLGALRLARFAWLACAIASRGGSA